MRLLDDMNAVNPKVAEKYVEAFVHVAKEGNPLVLPGDLANMGAAWWRRR